MQKVTEWILVEKKNLINIFKLVIKELIQSSNLNNKTIDNKSTHFIYFFDVFENILDNGLKSKLIFPNSSIK
jgi:RUN and FYVE domain-containing protein 1